MKFTWSYFLFFLLLAVGSLITSCNDTHSSNKSDTASVMNKDVVPEGNIPHLKPKGAKPAWAPDITDNMQVVIEKLESYQSPPIETLKPEEVRRNPSPATAVMDVMKDNNIPMPPAQVDTIGKDIPVTGGNIHVRIYTPKTGSAPFPVIVYYHGGGWVIANINTYDASASGISAQTGAVVVSVNYRQGPEYKFPTAHTDAFEAYQWVLKNMNTLKGSQQRIALLGESAGGNLAASVSIMARDNHIQVPVYEVLVYPIANNDLNNGSYTKNANAKPLNKPMMAWFFKNYLPNMAASADSRISLVKADLKGLPPTTIITDELDPLHDEGKLLADKMKIAGVAVNYKNYEGVTHEFFGMAAVLQEAKDAQTLASTDLKEAFKK